MGVWGVVAALIVGAGVWSAVDTGAGDSARSRLGVIAPAAPGGGWDLVARESQQALKSDGIVNNVQVVNIPGAAGTIGLGQLADMGGQAGTLMVTGTVMVGGIIANDSDATLADVTPIARLAEDFEVIVVPGDSPYQNLEEFIAGMAGRPRWHRRRRRLQGRHRPPAGRADREGRRHRPAADQLHGVLRRRRGLERAAGQHCRRQHLRLQRIRRPDRGRNVRALAMGTKERVDGIDVPSLGEQGVDVELNNWRGLVAPPGLTAEQQQALIDIVGEMTESADLAGHHHPEPLAGHVYQRAPSSRTSCHRDRAYPGDRRRPGDRSLMTTSNQPGDSTRRYSPAVESSPSGPSQPARSDLAAHGLSELVVPGILVAIAIFLIIGTMNMNLPPSVQVPGPTFFPDDRSSVCCC